MRFMDMLSLEETWRIISPGLLGKEGEGGVDPEGRGSQAMLPGSVSREATRPQSCVWCI